MTKPCVLIVDDEGSVLRSLRRGLRLKAKEWELIVDESPSSALSRLETLTPLVVMSDKRMPEMDGADFLQQVQRRSPLSIRVILSGDTSGDTVISVANVAHLMLPKPYELDDLVKVLNAAVCLHSLPVSTKLREQIGYIKTLPALPHVYQKLAGYLQNTSDPSNKKIADIINQDIAILSKILQLANSSFLGFASPSVSALDAVTRLGQDLITNLVLCYGLFDQGDVDEKHHAHLSSQAEKVATTMMSLATELGMKRPDIDYSFVVGLLHNVGGLITQDKDNPQQIALVSGYLLKLWGFNNDMVTAILHHTDPSQVEEPSTLCACLHIATTFVRAKEQGLDFLSDEAALCTAALERAGLMETFQSWLDTMEQKHSEPSIIC